MIIFYSTHKKIRIFSNEHYVLYRQIKVHIPWLYKKGDIFFFSESTTMVKCRVTVAGAEAHITTMNFPNRPAVRIVCEHFRTLHAEFKANKLKTM